MKLFVWTNPEQLASGGGMLYVVAESLEQALEVIAFEKPILNPLTRPEPDKILAVPCLEYVLWTG